MKLPPFFAEMIDPDEDDQPIGYIVFGALWLSAVMLIATLIFAIGATFAGVGLWAVPIWAAVYVVTIEIPRRIIRAHNRSRTKEQR